jgi:hypothetical protein
MRNEANLAALPFGGSDNAWNLVGDRDMRNARKLGPVIFPVKHERA